MSPAIDPFDDYSNLLELVQFAIRKEVEAADFYRSLMTRLDLPRFRDELAGLANMEDGHRQQLEKLNVAEAATEATRGLSAMKTADYETPGEPGPGLSRRQLLEVAIGREVAAWCLYSDMARLLPDSMLKQLLDHLAAEERQHRQYLERLAVQAD